MSNGSGITATQSYCWVLREAFIGLLQPLFPGYTVRRNRAVPIQVPQLPVLGVYLASERMTGDGDWDAGTIRFIHDCQFGFSVIIANNDSDASEQQLDAAWWTLMNGLWCNAGLTNLIESTTPDNTRFEGVTTGARRHVWGTAGLNNETPTGELQYDAAVRFRTEWAPTITTDLDEIAVTVIPAGYDPNQTPPISVDIDLTANQRSNGNGRSVITKPPGSALRGNAGPRRGYS